MKLMTRNTDYAIRALCYIACKQGNIVSVAELTKELKTPHSFLRRILQELQSKGLLASYKGIGGGFMLSGNASSISLLNVIEIFQGSFSLKDCKLKKRNCPNTKICNLRKRITHIEQYLSKELRSITIQSLVNGRSYSIMR